MKDSYTAMAEKYFEEYSALLITLENVSVGETKIAKLAKDIYLGELNPEDHAIRHRFSRRFKNWKARKKRIKKEKDALRSTTTRL